ncbi:MAG TPA: hypothetical protein VH796_13025 [Nitrososphaeraceae archaeon]|jgi:hypothetical protein
MAELSSFIKPTSISSSNYVNKSVISLDGLLLGHVTKEENNKMIISTDYDNGNKLIIPRCKVFSEDRKSDNTIIVDIEYHEVSKYRISEL